MNGGDSGNLGTYVRYWLHYSDLASSFYKQFGGVRKIRDDYEKQIITSLEKNGMEKATIQIGGGQLRVSQRREPNPLTLAKIEELLHLYYRQKGGRDETMDMMTFIRANRGYTTVKSLKKSGTNPPQSSNTKQIL
jgi:Family of unknown function (DUF5760)